MKSLRASSLASAVVAAALASCTLLGSREISQCDGPEDCAGNTTRKLCSADHLCVVDPSALAGGDGGGGGEDAGDAGPVACKATADCPREPPSVCLDGTCAPLLSQECPRLPNGTYREAYREEGTLLVGAYVFEPLSAGREVRAIEAALEQINAQLPKTSRIAALLCEKKPTAGAESAKATIGALKRLKVPLVFGQFEASELQTLDPQGLAVWSTLGNTPGLQAEPRYRFLVDELKSVALGFPAAIEEAKVRADALPSPPAGSYKVEVVRNDQEGPRLLAEAIATGLGAIPNLVTAPALVMPAAFERKAPDPQTVADELLTRKPDILVAIGGDEIVELMTQLESNGSAKRWPGAQRRPIWIVGPWTKFNPEVLVDLNKTATTKSDLPATRLLGVDFGGDATILSNSLVAQASGVRHIGSVDALYDALFPIALARLRADFNRKGATKAFTAAELTTGLDEVLKPPTATPKPVDMSSPAALLDAVAAVQQGSAIAYTGTTGTWKFLPGARASRREMGVSYYCVHPTLPELRYYNADASVFSATVPPANTTYVCRHP